MHDSAETFDAADLTDAILGTPPPAKPPPLPITPTTLAASGSRIGAALVLALILAVGAAVGLAIQQSDSPAGPPACGGLFEDETCCIQQGLFDAEERFSRDADPRC